MNRRLIPLTVFLVITACTVPGSSHAQSWTTEQLEVWRVIQSQWQATMDKDTTWPDRLLHDRFMGWNNATPAPRDKASTAKWSRYNMEDGTTLVQELSPLGIVVQGSTAVAHYVYSVASEDREGKRQTRHGRYTDVLVRDGGSWRFLAWHGGADPNGND